MKKTHTFILISLFWGTFSFGQSTPTLRVEDKIRIREAIRISDLVGEQVWKGIGEVPFVVLLVTDGVEFLINHPYPSQDFKFSENDPILKTKILYRPRQFSPNLLATFPAVNGVNCIVMGTPENTSRKSSDWIITMLHEHFHQLQYTRPDYYNSVNELDLAGDDQTGMWQLNYPFPYEDLKVVRQFENYRDALLNAVTNLNEVNFQESFEKCVFERAKFKQLLDPASYRYFSFQLWQEGIARYAEFRFLKELESYIPTQEVMDLSDYVDLTAQRDSFLNREISVLRKSDLSIDKRVTFYALGFAEGIILDKLNPCWRELYFKKKFYLDNYFGK